VKLDYANPQTPRKPRRRANLRWLLPTLIILLLLAINFLGRIID
jgi:hypothetical protein